MNATGTGTFTTKPTHTQVTVTPLCLINSDINRTVSQFKELHTNDLFNSKERYAISGRYLERLKIKAQELLNEVELHIQDRNE